MYAKIYLSTIFLLTLRASFLNDILIEHRYEILQLSSSENKMITDENYKSNN